MIYSDASTCSSIAPNNEISANLSMEAASLHFQTLFRLLDRVYFEERGL